MLFTGKMLQASNVSIETSACSVLRMKSLTCKIYTVGHKKYTLYILAITRPNVDQFYCNYSFTTAFPDELQKKLE